MNIIAIVKDLEEVENYKGASGICIDASSSKTKTKTAREASNENGAELGVNGIGSNDAEFVLIDSPLLIIEALQISRTVYLDISGIPDNQKSLIRNKHNNVICISSSPEFRWKAVKVNTFIEFQAALFNRIQNIFWTGDCNDFQSCITWLYENKEFIKTIKS